MTKLVVLDWDDCITSGSSEAYYACYSEAIKKSGIEKTAEEVKSGVKELWGRPHRDVIAKIIGTDNSFLTEVSDNYEECIFTDTFSSHISLVSGAKQKLEELKDNYQLAIATGMDGSLLREHILPRFGMQDLFVAIRSSSTT
jgi:phosphoglycolate phosphatase-like HAD superfamily hydrolase